jgi:two-component system, NarL family, sensor kinase
VADERVHESTRRLAATLSVVLLLATVSILGATAYLQSTFDHAWLVDLLLLSSVCLSSTVTGLLIAIQRPGNRIGLLLSLHGFLVALVFGSDPYATYAGLQHPGRLPGAGWAEMISTSYWPLLFICVATILYRFPDGRCFSPRWRRYELVSLCSYAVYFVGVSVGTKTFPAPDQSIPVPTPYVRSIVAPLTVVVLVGIMAHLIGGALAARARFRASTGATRLQLLWFTWAGVAIPGALAICWLDNAIYGTATYVTGIAICTAGTMISLSIAIAILRYQLFDIELVVSQSLVYGTLAAGLAVIYAAGVYGLGSLIDNRGVGGLAAVVATAIFVEPLRSRIRSRAERWVYGDRADPYRALTRLGERMQATLAPDQLLTGLVDSVAEALRLPYIAIELSDSADDQPAASHGTPDSHGNAETLAVPMAFRGEPVATLRVELPSGRELRQRERQLLGDLAGQGAVGVHALRLTMDLQQSRQQLVTAREEERRRLRRDLHDGLGPELAAIVMQLDAGTRLATDSQLEGLLGSLATQTRQAIAEIRRLVYELRPPALDEVGLVGAIRQQATRLTDAQLTFEVVGPESTAPLPAAVEVAAYRIAVEAMTNAVRHADARRCRVEICLNGSLELTVADNGRGISPARRAGVGLASMRERAAELGGRCSVESTGASGTLIAAVLPLPDPA